jgi:hypothetical protein
MKLRSLFVSGILTTLIISQVSAQGFHLGIKGGANIGKIDGQSFNQQFKFGYSLGAFAELNFNKTWGIQPELLWNQSNTQTSDNFSILYNGVTQENITLNYLSIPILITVRPIPLLSFQFGPQFGILLSQNKDLFNNGEDAFKEGDISILGGAQLNLGGLRVGARYYAGLTDMGLKTINGTPNHDTWKNQGFQLYVGFRII